MLDKLNVLWLKIPESTREILKEVWRWVVATIYSIILELITDPTFTANLQNLDAKVALSLVLKTIVIRFLDRIAFVAKGTGAVTKLLTLSK